MSWLSDGDASGASRRNARRATPCSRRPPIELAHEYGLREELGSDWAVAATGSSPWARRDSACTRRNPGGEPLDAGRVCLWG